LSEKNVLEKIQNEINKLEKESKEAFKSLLEEISKTAEMAKYLEDEANYKKDIDENESGGEHWLIGNINNLQSLVDSYLNARIKHFTTKALIENLNER
jgi:DNA repair photolyase